MRRKLILLAALAATASLALGAAMAWSATHSEGSSGPASADPWAAMHNGGDMGAMHRGLGDGDMKRMAKACEKAMERGGAMMDADDMAEHMGGGMMGPSMMGGTWG